MTRAHERGAGILSVMSKKSSDALPFQFLRYRPHSMYGRSLPVGLGLGLNCALTLGAVVTVFSDLGGLAVLPLLALVPVAIVSFQRPVVALEFAVLIGGTLGGLRRVIEYFGPSGHLTSVLPLMPAMLVLLGLISTYRRPEKRRAFERRSSSSTEPFGEGAYKALVAAIILGAVNPFGKGLALNFLAGCILLISVLCFTLGESFPEKDRTSLLRAVILVGFLNSAYVLVQQAFGVAPWDKYWIENSGYASLYLAPGVIRSLGLSSSVAESAAFCGIFASLSFVYFLQTRKLALLVGASIGSLALLVCGVRSTVLLTAVAIVIAASTRSDHFPRGLICWSIGVGAGLVGISRVLYRVLPSDSGLNHVFGFTSGLGEAEYSSLPHHQDMAISGVLEGIRSLVGSGAGQFSQLARDGFRNLEFDIATLAVMSGVLGLVSLLWFYYRYFSRFGRITLEESASSVPFLVITISTFGQWLNIGYYGISILAWTSLGAVFYGSKGASQMDPCWEGTARNGFGRAQ